MSQRARPGPNAPIPAGTREAHLLDAIEAERKKRGTNPPTERETYLLEQLEAERKKRGAFSGRGGFNPRIDPDAHTVAGRKKI